MTHRSVEMSIYPPRELVLCKRGLVGSGFYDAVTYIGTQLGFLHNFFFFCEGQVEVGRAMTSLALCLACHPGTM